MLVRETKYYFMSSNLLNKRIERVGEKIQSETDIEKKIELLGDLTDMIKVTIRKNRKDKKFLKEVQDTLADLITENEL